MGYKGQKFGKSHLVAKFVRLHSLKCCRFIAAALHPMWWLPWHTASLLVLPLSCVSGPTHTQTQDTFYPFSGPRCSVCVHPLYLYVSTSRMPGGVVESRQKLQQRTKGRPMRDDLFSIYLAPWQFPVWPVDSSCVRPCLGLTLGPCALFHILDDVYTSVYSLFFPFSSPFSSSSPFLYFSRPSSIGRLVLPSF